MAGAPVGNKNAAKEKRIITNALRRAVAQNPDKLKEACEKVLEDAVNGNLAAFNSIADRLDGKPTLTIAGDEDNPLEVITKVEIVPLGSKKDTDT